MTAEHVILSYIYVCHITAEHVILSYTFGSWGYHLTKTNQNAGTQPIYKILHAENRLVSCIETYLILI